MSALAIFHVDDSAADALLFQVAVELEGLSSLIQHVTDGQAALDYLRDISNDLPGLMLLDLGMPGMSGLDVLAEIQKDPRLAKVPVIVLSSSRDEHDIEHSYRLGANAYIVKPSGMDGFKTMVKTIDQFWFRTATLPRARVRSD